MGVFSKFWQWCIEKIQVSHSVYHIGHNRSWSHCTLKVDLLSFVSLCCIGVVNLNKCFSLRSKNPHSKDGQLQRKGMIFQKFSCALGELDLLSFKSQQRSSFDCFWGFQIVSEVNVSIDVVIIYSICFNQQSKIWICALWQAHESYNLKSIFLKKNWSSKCLLLSITYKDFLVWSARINI